MKFNFFKKKKNLKHRVVFEVESDGSIKYYVDIVPPNHTEKSIFVDDISKLFFYIQSQSMTLEFCNILTEFGNKHALNKEVNQILSYWKSLINDENENIPDDYKDDSVRPTEVFGQYFRQDNTKQ
jgi:hypothetical protein